MPLLPAVREVPGSTTNPVEGLVMVPRVAIATLDVTYTFMAGPASRQRGFKPVASTKIRPVAVEATPAAAIVEATL